MVRIADPDASTLVSEDDGGLSRGVQGAPPNTTEDCPLIASRYELISMLGAGSMGAVYCARDRELDELVALKMLREDLADTPDMLERFRREVKLARRVTHRNVARTYDIGEHGTSRFLTMEFVDGETLASRARDGRIDLANVVRIGIDLCAGLEAAHQAGVLHRDLKPENVILANDGRAVITDFGIARAAVESEEHRAHVGLLGTPAYMAPEQVEGSRHLDARADLYALGTILYELVTGESAWKRKSLLLTLTTRMLVPPPDPRVRAPNLPGPFAELIQKLMARDRADRYATADDTAQALRMLADPTPSPEITAPIGTERVPHPDSKRDARLKTVAVLPLANLGSPDDAYLVESVTEDVIDLLSVVPTLRVRTRGEAARFMASARDAREAGRFLDVDVVIDGSLRRVGDSIHISFRLVTIADGFQLWAKRFVCSAAQVLGIAEDAAQAIARAMTASLEREGRSTLTSDPVAQDLFLRGRWLSNRGWLEGNPEAVDLLRRALELAPGDARIAGTYALAIARSYAMAMASTDALRKEALEACERASLLGATRSEVRVATGLIHLQHCEVEAAITSFRAALAVSPNNVEALEGLGRVAIEIGRAKEGLELLTRASEIEPDYVMPRLHAARLHGVLGDHRAFLETAGPAPEHGADLSMWLTLRARDVLWRRDRIEAQELTAFLESRPIPPRAKFGAIHLLGVTESGLVTDELIEAIRDYLALSSRQARRICFNAQMQAEIFLAGGRPELALEPLKIADATGIFDILFFERCELLDVLRNQPEFITILENVRRRADRIANAFDASSHVGPSS